MRDSTEPSHTPPPTANVVLFDPEPAIPAGWKYEPVKNGELFDSFYNMPIIDDIKQGNTGGMGAGDCFFLSSLAAVVNTNPAIIKNNIQDLGKNPDGTEEYRIRFYNPNDLSQPIYVDVNNDMPRDGNSTANVARQDNLSGKQVEWASLYEKAYAQLSGSYMNLMAGGDEAVPMAVITGQPASRYETNQFGAPQIKQALQNPGATLVADTPGFLPTRVIDGYTYSMNPTNHQVTVTDQAHHTWRFSLSHVYTITGSDGNNVEIRNPHNIDDPSYSGPAQTSWEQYQTVPDAVFRVVFGGVVVGNTGSFTASGAPGPSPLPPNLMGPDALVDSNPVEPSTTEN